MPTDDDLLTTSEVADIARVTVATVQRWCREEKIAYVSTPGGQIRIHRSAIAEMTNPTVPQ